MILRSTILAIVTVSALAKAQLPESTVCLQALSEVKCAASASDCYYGHSANAKCNQSALFKTQSGTFIAATQSAEGRSYECGWINTDSLKAETHAKVALSALTGSWGLVPVCR